MKTRPIAFAVRALAALVPLTFFCTLIVLTGGCGSRFGDYCKAAIQCEGGNDKDVDACQDSLDGCDNAANAYGCNSEANAYADCITQKSGCNNKNYTTNECDNEGQALASCVKAASGNGDGDFVGCGI